MSILQKINDFCSYWYFQYMLNTALYMLEPWERKLFNSLMVGIIAMCIYTTYLFLPGHIRMLQEFFSYYLDGYIGPTSEPSVREAHIGT